MEEKKGFFYCLFDLSLEEPLTIRLVKILYGVGIGVAGIVGIFLIVTAFGQSFGMGLVHVIAAPIVFLLAVIILRVGLELLLTLFRIETNTRVCKTGEVCESTEAAEPKKAPYEE